VRQLDHAVAHAGGEAPLLSRARALLRDLVAHDDWLPAPFARPHPQHYQQYLLHADAAQRFSVVRVAWGPGQGTPIHDHTVWGLIGMLRGAEESQPYARDARGRRHPHGPARRLPPGIHVYGAAIGRVRRHVSTEEGAARPFVSGSANTAVHP